MCLDHEEFGIYAQDFRILVECWHYRKLGFSNLVWSLIITLHILFILSCRHFICSILSLGPARPETESSNITK